VKEAQSKQRGNTIFVTVMPCGSLLVPDAILVNGQTPDAIVVINSSLVSSSDTMCRL
jgi:hypothetical protein